MEDLLLELARQYRNRYYGKYRGFVTDNDDPEKRGRIRLLVPSVLGETPTGWALPSLPFGGLADQGLFVVPEVDAQVWLLKTPSGHGLQFDDESGKEKFRLAHPAGTEMTVDEKGTVIVADAKGNTLTLDADAGQVIVEDANGNSITLSSSGVAIEDANGNKVEMAASGITVKGQQVVVEGQMVMLAGQGGEPIIKGQSFLTLFATHVHPSAMGPTGPPIPQGEMSTLSMKVKTS
jgi:catechol 2,3-dioxygenase-like lactoylglutathione lyase family enzyme